MKLWRLLILVFMVTGLQAQVRLVHTNSFPPDDFIYIFKDSTGQFAITKIWECFINNKFARQTASHGSVELGLVTHIYWLAIPVKNATADSLDLLTGINNGGIFQIAYYQLNMDGSTITSNLTGTNYDFTTRPIQNRHFYFPLKIKPRDESIIVFRIDMRGNAFHVPLQIVTKDHLNNAEAKINTIYAFFSGWLILIIFLSFGAFVLTRARQYIYYCLYISSYFMFFIGDGNYDVMMLYPHSSFMATISPTVYAVLGSAFALVFMTDFLRLKTTHKKLFRLSWIWIFLLSGALILLPLAYVLTAVMPLRLFTFAYCLVTISGTWLIQIYCAVCRIRNRFKPGYLYGLSIMVVLLCCVVYVFRVLNIIPAWLPSFVYLPIGFGLEIAMLSCALIYSYSYYKNQHLQVSRQLLEVQETEQKRIAEDLHDDLGSSLAAIKTGVQNLDLKNGQLASINDLIADVSNNVRRIAHNLMPPGLEEAGLEASLQHYINQLNTTESIIFQFSPSGQPSPFSKQQELSIYRIIIELINNIVKHAGATQADITIVNDGYHFDITVEDNGHGFQDALPGGIGLKNVTSRLNYLEGELRMDTGKSGTTMIIVLPLNRTYGK